MTAGLRCPHCGAFVAHPRGPGVVREPLGDGCALISALFLGAGLVIWIPVLGWIVGPIFLALVVIDVLALFREWSERTYTCSNCGCKWTMAEGSNR